MGERIKLREAQRRATAEAIAARLRAHARPKSNPAFIDAYCGFDLSYRERIESYRKLALRAPEDWRCRLRCRAPERRFLELVEFSFARYGVADHLKNAWLAAPNARDDLTIALAADQDGIPDLRRWYIIAAQGGSLHKEATHRYLTKLETHHFVGAPAEVTTTAHAFWYAIARAQTDDAEVALKVSRSKLARFPVVAPFWKDVARFFARHPIAILEMNDLTDYLHVALQEDPRFSLKGRSLLALRRRMAEWHRILQTSPPADAGTAIACPTSLTAATAGSRSGGSGRSGPARSSPAKAAAWGTASRPTKTSASAVQARSGR